MFVYDEFLRLFHFAKLKWISEFGIGPLTQGEKVFFSHVLTSLHKPDYHNQPVLATGMKMSPTQVVSGGTKSPNDLADFSAILLAAAERESKQSHVLRSGLPAVLQDPQPVLVPLKKEEEMADTKRVMETLFLQVCTDICDVLLHVEDFVGKQSRP